MIFRFWLASWTMSVLTAAVFAQSPPSASSSPIAASAPSSPSAITSAKTDDLINSLSATDLRAVVALLKSNFAHPDAVSETELNRAIVQGLMVRLPYGIMLLPSKENKNPEAPNTLYSEILGGHIGYLRIGSLTSVNLQALDKAVANFPAKKVDGVIVDLRASSAAGDFVTAAEFAKRFCPRSKLLFALRKPAAHQDRSFNSDHDPLFQGLVMVLADADTIGPAEALAAALRFYNKALVIGQPTSGGAVEYSDVPLPSGKILRIAVAEAISPEGHSLFPDGVKPDIPVEMSMAEKRQIFQLSAEKGMASFVYETAGPHMNEAALLAGTNPEVDAAQAAQRRRGRVPEKQAAHDPVLQRALDVVTSIEIYQKR